MVGRGNVFFTYAEETQYPVPLADLHSVVRRTFQLPSDLSVMWQTLRFDFNLLHQIKLELSTLQRISDVRTVLFNLSGFQKLL